MILYYYVPDNVLGTKGTVVNKIKSSPYGDYTLLIRILSNKLAKK